MGKARSENMPATDRSSSLAQNVFEKSLKNRKMHIAMPNAKMRNAVWPSTSLGT
jgi:hypothetical protein